MHLIIKEFDHPEVNLPVHAIDRTSILLGENRVELILLFLFLLVLLYQMIGLWMSKLSLDLHDSLSLSLSLCPRATVSGCINSCKYLAKV